MENIQNHRARNDLHGLGRGVLLALIMAWADAQGAVIALRPVADTSLIQAAPNNNNGGERWVLAGTTQNYTYNRGLFLFDFTPVIPDEAVVRAVQFQLEVTRQPSDGYNAAPFGLYRMLRPWGEGDNTALNNSGGLGAPADLNEATWNQPFALSAENWATPGGGTGLDFVAEPSAEQFVYGTGDSPYVWGSTPELVADVQGWLANPDSNFGWMLRCQTEEVNFAARRFGSSEDANFAPVLSVEFEVVPEPDVLKLVALSLGLLALCFPAPRRRR